MMLKAPQDVRILVVGSLNMDVVFRVTHLPRPGETRMGESLEQVPGGKGANQAVAAARLGAHVDMIGRLGDDDPGTALRNQLHRDGVGTAAVTTTNAVSSGVAIIGVEDSGQNCITVIPGANGRLTADDIARSAPLFSAADVVLLQLEVPLPTVARAMDMARQHHVTVLLDPAPAVEQLPQELRQADVLCPNETEASLLTGIDVHNLASAEAAARTLQRTTGGHIMLTMGGDGVLVVMSDGTCEHVPAVNVDAVDTTAAGDAFAGAVGVYLAMGGSILDAARFGCRAGALAASRPGAQPAMPTWAEVSGS